MVEKENKLVTIIIPARTEKYLNTTIREILDKATGEIDIIPVLDGYGDAPYEKIKDPRVRYLSLPKPHNHERHKRQGINAAVSVSKAKYVCWIDAHCVLAPGFDEILVRDCEPNMVMVPRRYKLNAKNWSCEGWEGRPPIDYEYWMWQFIKGKNRIAGYRWDDKSRERAHIKIDDIFTAQGSFFFMHRDWFHKIGLMQIEGYTGWGQEGEEVCLTSIYHGGRAVVNKNTYYAHMHKGQMHGRMYKYTNIEPSYAFSYNLWVHERREFFKTIIDKFGLFPNWKKDWQVRLYGNKL